MRAGSSAVWRGLALAFFRSKNGLHWLFEMENRTARVCRNFAAQALHPHQQVWGGLAESQCADTSKYGCHNVLTSRYRADWQRHSVPTAAGMGGTDSVTMCWLGALRASRRQYCLPVSKPPFLLSGCNTCAKRHRALDMSREGATPPMVERRRKRGCD
jgi:hypothetical protein